MLMQVVDIGNNIDEYIIGFCKANFTCNNFGRSSTLLIMAIKFVVDSFIISTYSYWSLFNSVAFNNSVIPITPFKGVFNSWLILARNCSCIFLASSASRLAFSASSSAFFLYIISSIEPIMRIGFCVSFLIK